MAIPPFPPHAKTIDAVGRQATSSHHRVSGDLTEQTRTRTECLASSSQLLKQTAVLCFQLCDAKAVCDVCRVSNITRLPADPPRPWIWCESNAENLKQRQQRQVSTADPFARNSECTYSTTSVTGGAGGASRGPTPSSGREGGQHNSSTRICSRFVQLACWPPSCLRCRRICASLTDACSWSRHPTKVSNASKIMSCTRLRSVAS